MKARRREAIYTTVRACHYSSSTCSDSMSTKRGPITMYTIIKNSETVNRNMVNDVPDKSTPASSFCVNDIA